MQIMIVNDEGRRWPPGARLVYEVVGWDPRDRRRVAGDLVAILLAAPARARVERALAQMNQEEAEDAERARAGTPRGDEQ